MPSITNFLGSLRNHPASPVAAWVVIGVVVVSGFEGFASKPYVDRQGTGHPETWCYGETAADGGPVPPYGTLFTKEECQASLQKKLVDVYDPLVRECIDPKVLDGHPNREAALVSFVYNGGQGWLCNPRRHTYTAVARNLNAGNITAGCNAMLSYDRAAGRVLAGLVSRRKKESALCKRDD